MAETIVYPWKRYWVKQGENPTMDSGLFVEPMADDSLWKKHASNGVSISDLNDVPCLVLLGDVGMGKSMTLQQASEQLKKQFAGQNHAVVYRDLRGVPESIIERRIFENPEVKGWQAGKNALTVFLDSVDECWRRVNGVEHLLFEGIKSSIHEGCLPFQIRLTCRSAEWRGEAGKLLGGLFSGPAGNNSPLQVFVLAPLSAQNVREAAKANNIDGDLLLEKIAVKEAHALASHPITLQMLLDVYKESGDFPNSRKELYERGCLRLCTDENARYGQGHRKTFPQHRMVIASRVAALSMFTNRLLINSDYENPHQQDDVIEVSDVSGHADEQVGGDRVTVDRESIIETLQTGLFTERIDGIQAWRHQSYAEFLAAHYLSIRRLAVPQIVDLLTNTSDNSGRIVPQLEEAACWMAEINPAVFAELVARNADTFLRCDSTYWNDQERDKVVASYLALIRSHEALNLDWQLKYRLKRLDHPALETQLRPVITNRQEDPLVREAAIDISGHCGIKSIASDIIDVFLDPNDVFRVRQRAGIALHTAANDQIRELLKSRKIRNWAGDLNDDLRGYYLQIMWPTHVSLNDLMPFAPRQQPNYTGSYRMFLEYDFAKSASDDDLARILNWLRDANIDFDHLGAFGSFPSKIMELAIGRMNIPVIRDAVLRLLAGDEGVYKQFRGGIEFGELSAESRLHFWRAIVHSDLDMQKLNVRSDIRAFGVLSGDDAVAFINEYRHCADGPLLERWRILCFCVFRIDDSEALDSLSELAQTDKGIAEILAARTSCPIVPDEENWLKKEFERQKRTAAPEAASKPSFEALIEDALKHFESGHLSAFWHLGELLDRDPGKLNDGIIFPRLQWSCEKSWKSLNLDLQRRILNGIVAYFEAQKVDETLVWDPKQSYRPYDVATPFLVLLFDEDKKALEGIDEKVWSRWISVILVYSSRRNGTHGEAFKAILSLAYAKAKQPFLATLRRYLDLHFNDDSERRIIWHLPAIWDSEIKALVLDLIRDKPLKTSAAVDMFLLLNVQEPEGAEQLLLSYVGDRDSIDKCNVYVPSAIAVLLANYPESKAANFLARIRADAKLGRDVIPILVRGHNWPKGWVSKIPPRELAQLWEWLGEQYPDNPYEKDGWHGSVTIAHEIYQFRMGVFQTLTQSTAPDACDAVEALMKRRPNDFWLGEILAEKRKAADRSNWIHTSPAALMQVLTATDKRLVRTAGELSQLVLESLQRFEKKLHGSPPSMELWNETLKTKNKYWQPKDEKNLSNCLKRFLEDDLADHGVMADREVEIRPHIGSDPAELVDILVRAIPFGENGKPGVPVTVVIEVKCAWNKKLLSDIENQLYDRYLKNAEFHFGIYVVAYFTCEAWNWEKDERKTSGESTELIDTLRTNLTGKARSLSNAKKLVQAIIIDARINV